MKGGDLFSRSLSSIVKPGFGEIGFVWPQIASNVAYMGPYGPHGPHEPSLAHMGPPRAHAKQKFAKTPFNSSRLKEGEYDMQPWALVAHKRARHSFSVH